MVKVEAIIRPEKLEAVRQGLGEVGCSGLMISEIEGHGKQKGVVQQWRGEKYRQELIPKIKIEAVVKEAEVERVVDKIVETARTGEIGDGKIFVSPVSAAIRIRTGEKGETAL